MTRRCRHGLQTDWCWGNSGWGLETRDLDWEIGRHQRLCLSYRPCPIRPYGAPSPRGEGCDTKIPLSPFNLRPFGAPPSIGRREYPRKPLPLEGAAERSEAGLASFWGEQGALVYRLLETIFPALFHTASTLSGSLRSPPSPRREGFVSGIAVSPSNLRPFGAPPSIGRRECPHEPLPLEGAAEHSEAGWASAAG